jgi:hypothetical protein
MGDTSRNSRKQIPKVGLTKGLTGDAFYRVDNQIDYLITVYFLCCCG